MCKLFVQTIEQLVNTVKNWLFSAGNLFLDLGNFLTKFIYVFPRITSFSFRPCRAYLGVYFLCDIIDEHDGVFLTSQFILNEGMTYISLVRDMPYICVTKDAPGLIDRLLGEKNYCDLFGLLSDPDGLKAAIFTQSEHSKDGAKYTADRLAEKMGIQPEKFRELLPQLVKFRFLAEEQIVVDESEFRTYFIRQNNEFRPLLMTAWLLINSQQRYYAYCQTRETRFLEGKKA